MTDITPLLDALLNALYQNGFRRFYSGAALGLDTLAAERVLHLRSAHNDVCLSLAIPCADQARSWHEAQQLYREQLIYMADEVNVLSPHYYPGCMMVRNRFMVDRSSLCVCYLKQLKGGTMSTVAYAAHRNIPVLNLAIEELCLEYITGKSALAT